MAQLALLVEEERDDPPLVNLPREDVKRWREANYRNATPIYPHTPPRIAQARGPPEWDEDAGSASHWEDDSAMPGDPLAQPEPVYEFDQRVTW